jgi:hypothetical protein
MVETRSRRVKVSTVAAPAGLVLVIALAALSYVATRATITAGPAFAVPGATTTASFYSVPWRNGTNLVIIASFTPSRSVRVRSITVTGIDPKDTILERAEYGFWDGTTPLPSFSTQAEALPASLHPRTINGAFSAPANSRVFLRLLLKAISDAKVSYELTGIRVDAESWSWAHTTVVLFQKPVRITPPR